MAGEFIDLVTACGRSVVPAEPSPLLNLPLEVWDIVLFWSGLSAADVGNFQKAGRATYRLVHSDTVGDQYEFNLTQHLALTGSWGALEKLGAAGARAVVLKLSRDRNATRADVVNHGEPVVQYIREGADVSKRLLSDVLDRLAPDCCFPLHAYCGNLKALKSDALKSESRHRGRLHVWSDSNALLQCAAMSDIPDSVDAVLQTLSKTAEAKLGNCESAISLAARRGKMKSFEFALAEWGRVSAFAGRACGSSFSKVMTGVVPVLLRKGYVEGIRAIFRHADTPEMGYYLHSDRILNKLLSMARPAQAPFLSELLGGLSVEIRRAAWKSSFLWDQNATALDCMLELGDDLDFDVFRAQLSAAFTDRDAKKIMKLVFDTGVVLGDELGGGDKAAKFAVAYITSVEELVSGHFRRRDWPALRSEIDRALECDEIRREPTPLFGMVMSGALAAGGSAGGRNAAVAEVYDAFADVFGYAKK
jgi:hypothetical protein